jgi:hypothetical protein
MVIVSVTVRLSPEAEIVAVGDSNVDQTMVPDDDALKTPTLPIVTGNESDPLAVNVFVRV